MKSKFHFACACAVLFAATASAQEDETTPSNKMEITDVFVHFGSFTERSTYGSLEDFRKLAPNSRMLSSDLSDFGNSGGDTFNGSTMLTLSLGIKFRNKEKMELKGNPLLRIGLTYFSGGSLTGNLFRSERFPVDTLVSTQTGEVILVDSIASESYNMEQLTEQIRLDVSLIYRTNPEARWSLYGGIGFAVGVSLSARTEIYYNNVQFDADYHGSGNSRFGDFDSERVNNDMNFGLLAYVPLGLDFRLGNNKEFWKRTHLFYEVSPGINVTVVPELRTIANASIRNGLGLRVNWG